MASIKAPERPLNPTTAEPGEQPSTNMSSASLVDPVASKLPGLNCRCCCASTITCEQCSDSSLMLSNVLLAPPYAVVPLTEVTTAPAGHCSRRGAIGSVTLLPSSGNAWRSPLITERLP